MYLKRRLKRLEVLERSGGREDELEEHVSREAISRVSDEDLELIWGYLKRTEEEEGEPTPEEWAAIECYLQLRDEVRRDLQGA